MDPKHEQTYDDNPWREGVPHDDSASVRQLDYVRILSREGHLCKDDFPAGTYYRKNRLTKAQADRLIKLGKERKRVAAAERLTRRMFCGYR